MSTFVAGHVTKMWFIKLWITSFWAEILHLNFKEIVEKMMWSRFAAPSERNYQTFYKMQEKVVLAAILEGKSMPSKIDYEQSLFFLGPSSKSPETPLSPPTWRPIQIILVWKNQRAIKYLC